ncbi:MAG: HAMP domain-containing sensor histidine kinase [Thermodesulfobacteriota bacterium]|nr:HAMP domain-containing sensor histidine kinase [Thermodesulfobacteriota bacterium]
MNKNIKIKGSGLGIMPKLLIYFLVLSVTPLIVIGYVANKNLKKTSLQAFQRAKEMGIRNLGSAKEIGKTATENSVKALDDKSTEAIELRTVELADRIADFLYERDKDILIFSSLKPDPEKYLDVYLVSSKDITVHGTWPPEPEDKKPERLSWENIENKKSWRHRSPCPFKKISKPLYKEITFLDLRGQEKIKIANGKISYNLKDVSKKENTYCRAEDYFCHLSRLQKGEIYVSRVIGQYVKGWLYKTPEGIKVKPESAYAGKENPYGKKFEGIVRWAMPVFDGRGDKIGYITMALDHAHIMEFTDPVIPTEERFSDISDAGSGNYAFLWDDEDQCISHPRDFFICGYDPETGKKAPGWLAQDTFNEYKKSGLALEDFIRKLPSFRNFSLKKRGSIEQIKSGCISLDCRVLDTAPQCQGWHRGTEDGGSGSFLIFWSGLWKLTTYATVPYYTGGYGKSKRGFGYVTIGANVDEFHKIANITKANIEKSIVEQGTDIESSTNRARKLIEQSASSNLNLITIITLISALAVIGASIIISLDITTPLKRLTLGAVAMSKGSLNQSVEVKSRDEVGQLAKSFNEMAATVSDVDRMKSDFVTIASHELRTPIQAMLLGVSGLLEGYSGEIDEETREDLLLVKQGIERLISLVENLLDLSRIEAHKIELNISRTSVAEIINKAVEEISDLAKAQHHHITKNVHQDIPDIDVDKDRIIQVIINFLSNSIKFTPDGGSIIINAESRGKEVIFSVADNGYGIPLWAQENIFKKFFQADSIMSQKVGGTGLGLTITKAIIEEHGGSIRCESPVLEESFPDLPLGADRKGTIFVFRLPTHR